MIWIILGIIGSVLMTFLYCCLVISSRCSKIEEKGRENILYKEKDVEEKV